MMTTAMLLGLAWKSLIVAGLTLVLLRLARSRSSGERSMIAHAGLIGLLALPAAILFLPQWAPLPEHWFGETGLAAGDHLHYGVYLNGVAVLPVEWWDQKWIDDNVTPKLAGLSGRPFLRSSKCSLGVSAKPLWPAAPSTCPALTAWPRVTSIRSAWP